MENILNFKEFFKSDIINEKKNTDKLSGIVLLMEGKILIVKPKKFKNIKNKWSIPKGRIEKSDTMVNAFKELEEETGIKLINPVIKSEGKLIYKKGNKKVLNYYVIEISKKDLNVKVEENGKINKRYFKGSEISKVKFVDKKEALSKLEFGQLNVLKYL